tara:strand:+ start:9971 stop:11008 length:1038 start_codon:yes stop_codon:yes gene_type:complete
MKNFKKNIVKSDIRVIDALNLLDKLQYKTLLVNKSTKFLGTLTDGDIRRGLINNIDLNDSIELITNVDCITIDYKDFLNDSFSKYYGQINIIPILKSNKIYDVYNNSHYKNGNNKSSQKLNNLCNVLIMAGGLGTRMKPLTNFIPKPLVPIKNKSLIEHVMSNFSNFGIENFSISVNYKSDQIVDHFNNKKHPYKLSYIYEDSPLGTIGALRKLDFNGKSTFITNCDSLIDLDFENMYKFHKDNNFDFTIAVCEDIINVPYGVCTIKSDSSLNEIREKPQIINLINSGLYLCEEEAAKLIPLNKKCDATDLIAICQKNNLNIGVYKFRKELWQDVGMFSDYLSFL